MIDLHSHILPGLDDGAPSLEVALEMAHAFVDDGVQIVAATPHIMPGVWGNTGPAIRSQVALLQDAIDQEGLPLRVVTGADVHLAPGLAAGLADGALLSLADTRYVLIEPPHHVVPPRLEETFYDLTLAGYVPILTHPERLTWIKGHYATIKKLAQGGVWMQITSGSLRGAFGQSAKHWAERMLDDGLVHILASDAHDVARRRPDLSVGYHVAAQRVGDEEARHLVLTRPQAILDNCPPSSIPMPVGSGSSRGSGDQVRSTRGASRQSTSIGGSNAQDRKVGVLGGITRLLRRLR